MQTLAETVAGLLAATPGLRVAGFPEPDGSQPMSAAEFRMVREHLGLTGEALAAMLAGPDRSVDTLARSIRKWESVAEGSKPVPESVREHMEQLEAVHLAMVDLLAADLLDAAEVVLEIPAGDAGGFPGGWWRSVAWAVAERVPGLYVQYADE